MSIRQFFERLFEDDEPQGGHDESEIALAAASLMIEVARSDTVKQEIELNTIEQILVDRFALSPEKIHELIAAAADRVEVAHDLYQFTGLINDHYDYSEKRQLVYCMWLVAFADGHVEAIEDHIIRRVAGLLHVAHDDFIQMKIQARDSAVTGNGR